MDTFIQQGGVGAGIPYLQNSPSITKANPMG